MDKLFTVALVQGIYYLATGLWPLLHIKSFLWVTGPKVDIWLVNMVAVLIVVIGLVLMVAAIRKKISFEIIILAMGAAAGFIIIEVFYVSVNRIWTIYLLDAFAEVLLLAWWGILLNSEDNRKLLQDA